MKQLIITLEVKDKIDAYRAVSRLSFKFKVLKAIFEEKDYTFNEKKKPKDFLKDNFFSVKEI